MKCVPLVLLASGAFAGAGCEAPSEAEKMCRSMISGTLLNPETAEFHDFELLSEPQAVELFYMIGMEVTKARAVTAGTPDAAEDLGIQNQVKSVARETIEEATSDGAKLYSYRVRAEGRLGNTITTQYLCSAKPSDCECHSAETATP